MVKRGDSLHGIAWRFGVDYRDLVIWNGISNSDLIYEGQILNLKGSMISRGKKALFGRMKPKSRKNLGVASGIEWSWPASGSTKAILESGKISGLEIKGEAIRSTLFAKGKVVYSGNGLKGYGELIIIKNTIIPFLVLMLILKYALWPKGIQSGSSKRSHGWELQVVTPLCFILRLDVTGKQSIQSYICQAQVESSGRK